MTTERPSRESFRTLTRDELENYQLTRLNSLLAEVIPKNEFYQKLYQRTSLQVASLGEWGKLPLVNKSDLLCADGDIAAHHTYRRDQYTRLHRTSGTKGRPLIVMDTPTDWQWWLDTWQYVWDVAEVNANDVVFMAFSFGPFIGFWSAFEAAIQRGLQVVPGGGLTSSARIDLIKSSSASILCCTPTYALHLADEANRSGVPSRSLGIRRVIVAGEPGGSIPSVRQRIEDAWDAQVIDHSGATEIGPWGCGDPGTNELHVIESEFIAEFIPLHDNDVESSELRELVLTSLGRMGAPVFRFRTGDIVRPVAAGDNPCQFVRLAGGILGRVDDMVIIRGVNIFPSSIEAIVRQFPSISEFRITASRQGEMDQLIIEVEDNEHAPERLEERFASQLGLRVSVCDVPSGTLPQFDGKARRFCDLRQHK